MEGVKAPLGNVDNHVLLLYDKCMTMTSVTVRLSDKHMHWIKSTEKSTSDAIRSAIELSMKEQSYLDAAEAVERIPLDTEDEWGDPEAFMLQAQPK